MQNTKKNYKTIGYPLYRVKMKEETRVQVSLFIMLQLSPLDVKDFDFGYMMIYNLGWHT